MTTYCDICGDRAAPDEPIVKGRWALHQRFCEHDAVRLRFTPQWARLLYMLAKNDGRTLSGNDLGLRIADNPEEVLAPLKLAQVVASKVRAELRKLGITPPFENERGFGYRWAI